MEIKGYTELANLAKKDLIDATCIDILLVGDKPFEWCKLGWNGGNFNE